MTADAPVLFASTSLAARIERAECSLLADCAAAVIAGRPDGGGLVRAIAGGVATFASAGSPLNKVAGLGFHGPLEIGELAAIEDEFRRRSTPVQVEVSCLAEPSVAQLLTERGYLLIGLENVLGRRLPGAAPARPEHNIHVAPASPAEFSTWLDVVVTGFATPDAQGLPSHESFSREAIEQVIGDMATVPGFVQHLARRDGVPAGGASMRLSDGIAQLSGAATLPAHRRRGVQGALLAARLDWATQSGCDLAVVTTLPGSKSHENVQRAGFELLYTRAVLQLRF